MDHAKLERYLYLWRQSLADLPLSRSGLVLKREYQKLIGKLRKEQKYKRKKWVERAPTNSGDWMSAKAVWGVAGGAGSSSSERKFYNRKETLGKLRGKEEKRKKKEIKKEKENTNRGIKMNVTPEWNIEGRWKKWNNREKRTNKQ